MKIIEIAIPAEIISLLGSEEEAKKEERRRDKGPVLAREPAGPLALLETRPGGGNRALRASCS